MANSKLDFGALDAILAHLEVIDLVVHGTETIVGTVTFTGDTVIGNSSADTLTINASWPGFTAGAVPFFAGSPVTLQQDQASFSYSAATHSLSIAKVNGLTITASSGTITVTDSKALTISNSLTLAGTDGTTMTFPATSDTLAGLAQQNTFTRGQTITPNTVTALTLNAQSGTPVGGASVYKARINSAAGTITWITTPQTGNYASVYLDQDTLVNPSAGTLNTAATLFIKGAPIASTNVSISAGFAIQAEKTSSGVGQIQAAFGNNSTSTSSGSGIRLYATSAPESGSNGIVDLKMVRADASGGSNFDILLGPGNSVAAISVFTLARNSPVGSGSAYQSLNRPAATIAFQTNPQTGDYSSNLFDQATLTNPSSGTVPNAATVKIVGAPIASTNVTITNAYALWVAAGTSKFDGNFITASGTNALGGTQTANTRVVTTSVTSIAGSATTRVPVMDYQTNTLNFSGGTGQTGDLYQTYIRAVTVTATTSSTIPVAAGLKVDAPIASTNTTFTKTYSFWITGAMRADGNIDFSTSDTTNFVLGTGTGTKLGTATSQKLSFWNATPIVQPTTAIAAATFVANTSGIANDSATWDGYTVGQVVKALRNSGILA